MSTTEIAHPLKLDFESAGLIVGPEEFDAVDTFNDAYRYELIHGVVVVTPIPSPAHVGPNDLLGFLLHDYQRNHPDGAALDDTLPERHIATGANRRLCDRVVWTGLARQPQEGVDVPTIAVEFVSAGKKNPTRDYETKRDEYLETGVLEYWGIDRFQRQMTVYFPRSLPKIIDEHDVYQTELLPGFTVPLAELLAAADKWEPT